MAHKILDKRFISRVRPAWHGIGETFPADTEIVASQAMEKIAGDIRIDTRPIYYGPEFLCDAPIAVPEKRAVVRTSSQGEAFLGMVADGWHVTQYVDLARILDELSRTYKVETAGVIEDGGRAVVCLRGNDWNVVGDDMRTYFVAAFSGNPGESHAIYHSSVRWQCYNTLIAGLAHSSVSLRVPHTVDTEFQVRLAAELVASLSSMEERTKNAFEVFARTRIQPNDFEFILSKAFPSPATPRKLELLRNMQPEERVVFEGRLSASDRSALDLAQHRHEVACGRVERLRDAARDCYDGFENTGTANLRGTVWAAYNAATEVSDWREGKGAETSSLFGIRAREKARAFAAAAEVAQVVLN